MTGELTPGQTDYFRILERMDISDDFRRRIETVKAEMRAENERHMTLTAEPGDVIEFERGGQRFGGVVWQPPSQPDSLLAGDTFIRLRGEWIATTEHVVSIRRRTPIAD